MEDVKTVLPDLEGRSIDFYIEDFSDYQASNCKNVVEKYSKKYLEDKKKVDDKEAMRKDLDDKKVEKKWLYLISFYNLIIWLYKLN